MNNLRLFLLPRVDLNDKIWHSVQRHQSHSKLRWWGCWAPDQFTRIRVESQSIHSCQAHLGASRTSRTCSLFKSKNTWWPPNLKALPWIGYWFCLGGPHSPARSCCHCTGYIHNSGAKPTPPPRHHSAKWMLRLQEVSSALLIRNGVYPHVYSSSSSPPEKPGKGTCLVTDDLTMWQAVLGCKVPSIYSWVRVARRLVFWP